MRLLSSLSSLPPCCSLNREKNLVELSFLPDDTGKPDVFPASLGLPLLKQEEREREAAEKEHKGEEEKKKNQKRKRKRNQEGPEEAQPSSQEKSEAQKPQAEKRGRRRRRESASEQVSPSGRAAPSRGRDCASQPAGQPSSLLLD